MSNTEDVSNNYFAAFIFCELITAANIIIKLFRWPITLLIDYNAQILFSVKC